MNDWMNLKFVRLKMAVKFSSRYYIKIENS